MKKAKKMATIVIRVTDAFITVPKFPFKGILTNGKISNEILKHLTGSNWTKYCVEDIRYISVYIKTPKKYGFISLDPRYVWPMDFGD